jgi:excisionase family DNA binding protein
MQNVEERYFSTREIAAVLKVHEATVRRWIEAGMLRGVRLPGGWRVTERELTAFLERRRQEEA